MILRWLPLLILAHLGYRGFDRMKQILDVGRITQTQIELSSIVELLRLDSVDGSLPSEEGDEFSQYLRKNLKRRASLSNEDLALDPWGTPYRYQRKAQSGFRVSSAGPDKAFQTKDDINKEYLP